MALTPEGLTSASSSSSDAARVGLTSEDGRSYAEQQFQRQSREGEIESAAGTTPVSAIDPTSQKLADLTLRLDAGLVAAGANPIGPDDLAILNSAVVELQAYEELLAAPTEAPVVVDVPAVSQAGDVLECTMGNWEGEPTSYSYQWRLGGLDVADAGSPPGSYTVTAADVGAVAICIVTAANAVGSTVAPPSNDVIVADPSASRSGSHSPAREA